LSGVCIYSRVQACVQRKSGQRPSTAMKDMGRQALGRHHLHSSGKTACWPRPSPSPCGCHRSSRCPRGSPHLRPWTQQSRTTTKRSWWRRSRTWLTGPCVQADGDAAPVAGCGGWVYVSVHECGGWARWRSGKAAWTQVGAKIVSSLTHLRQGREGW